MMGRHSERQTPFVTGWLVVRQVGDAKRILIAEDEVVIAMELEAALSDAGFEAVGPALSAAELTRLIESEDPHCCIIDVGMVGSSARALLSPLVERGTPFLYLTGYGEDDLPADLPAAHLMRKPSGLSDVVEAVRTLLLTDDQPAMPGRGKEALDDRAKIRD